VKVHQAHPARNQVAAHLALEAHQAAVEAQAQAGFNQVHLADRVAAQVAHVAVAHHLRVHHQAVKAHPAAPVAVQNQALVRPARAARLAPVAHIARHQVAKVHRAAQALALNQVAAHQVVKARQAQVARAAHRRAA